MVLGEFVQLWFIDPIVQETGYNIVNTAVYALILIAAAMAAFFFVKKLSIEIDKKFFIAVVPFIFLGGILRAFEDLLEAGGANQVLYSTIFEGFVVVTVSGAIRNMLLVSPVIYITMFFIALSVFFLSILVEKFSKGRYQYYKVMFSSGVLLALLVLSQLKFADLNAAALMLSIAAFWFAVIFAARKYVAPKYVLLQKVLTKENSLLIGAHMFDASTTFVALQFYPYFEQHVLPGFVIGVLGPVSMFLLKLAVVPAVLYFIDKDLSKPEEAQKKTFFKIIVLVLGLGPGLRNFFRLVMGV